MSEHPRKPNARRRCAYCSEKLPFPFITVWFEEHGRSIGIRFCCMTELLAFFTADKNPYATAEDWLKKATLNVYGKLNPQISKGD